MVRMFAAERGVALEIVKVNLRGAENRGEAFLQKNPGLPIFESRMRCIPEAAAGLKQIAQEKLGWLDGLVEGRMFICGDRLTMADILLFASASR
eukprot:gene10822-10901_t